MESPARCVRGTWVRVGELVGGYEGTWVRVGALVGGYEGTWVRVC